MTRREMRDKVFQLLFMEEFHPVEEFSDQAVLYLETEDQLEEQDQQAVIERAQKVISQLDRIDQELSQVAKGWKLERMGKAELAILRLACFEIQMDEDIPQNVAINEAVELAKKYAEDNTGAFVNGVLARLVN